MFSLYLQKTQQSNPQLAVQLVRTLLNNLTNKTVKIRDQAFDALLEFLMYGQGLDDALVQQICQYEWMLVSVPKAVKQRAELIELCDLHWATRDQPELLE